MKKLSVFVSLSLMLSLLSWAEKYEYVRLKLDETITLEEGDVAKLMSFSRGTDSLFQFNDGEEDIEFPLTLQGLNGIVGPGVIKGSQGCQIYEIQRASETGANEYVSLKVGENITLESGDVAEVINVSNGAGYLQFNDGEEDMEFPSFDIWRSIVGPGVITTNQGCINFVIRRAIDTGSTTLSWNGSEWEGSDDSQLADNNSNNSSPVPDPNGINYDQLLGWCYFTDTPWFYSYTNGSWYYLHSLPDGIYVWNANLPDNGWVKLYG